MAEDPSPRYPPSRPRKGERKTIAEVVNEVLNPENLSELPRLVDDPERVEAGDASGVSKCLFGDNASG